MRDPSAEPDELHVYIAGPTADFGYYCKLEGGEEDTTIRPALYPLPKEGAEHPNGLPAEQDGHPDLDDWLKRTFD